LFRLQQGIDRDEHATGQRGAKQGHDGFQPFRQIDGDSLRPIQAQGSQPAPHGLDLIGEGGIIQRELAMRDGGRGGMTTRLFENQFVQQSGHLELGGGMGDRGMKTLI